MNAFAFIICSKKTFIWNINSRRCYVSSYLSKQRNTLCSVSQSHLTTCKTQMSDLCSKEDLASKPKQLMMRDITSSKLDHPLSSVYLCSGPYPLVSNVDSSTTFSSAVDKGRCSLLALVGSVQKKQRKWPLRTDRSQENTGLMLKAHSQGRMLCFFLRPFPSQHSQILRWHLLRWIGVEWGLSRRWFVGRGCKNAAR